MRSSVASVLVVLASLLFSSAWGPADPSVVDVAERSAAIRHVLDRRAAERSELAVVLRSLHASLTAIVETSTIAAEPGGTTAARQRALARLTVERHNLDFARAELEQQLPTTLSRLRSLGRGAEAESASAAAASLPAGLARLSALLDGLDEPAAVRRPSGTRLDRARVEAGRLLQQIGRESVRSARIVFQPLPARRLTPVDPARPGRDRQRPGTSREAAVQLRPPAAGDALLGGTGITPEITALAQSLGSDPRRIYQHVRNRFRFECYAGLLKGAQATLETGGGNDYDLAALTGALLEASGFEVRYARGTAIIPAQAMTEWLGLEDPAAANVILNTAGIAAVPVVNGSTIDHYRVDRLWLEVQAALRPGEPVSWLPLDPAFKRHRLAPGIDDMLVTAPFDEPDYLSATRTELTYEFYEQQVRDWLEANQPASSLADVPLGMAVLPETTGGLPRSLPYQLFATGPIYDPLPASVKHRVTIRVRYQGSTQFSHQVYLPAVALSRITLSYAVDPADQATVDGFGGLANTPAFVVDVIPQLKLDGVVVAQGGSIPYLDDEISLEIDFYKPGSVFDGTSTHSLRAGEWAAVGIDANQISDSLIQRTAATIVAATELEASGGTPDPDELVGAFLYLTIMRHHQAVRIGEEQAAALAQFRRIRGVSEGMAAANQEVISVGGVPFTTVPGALVVDVPRQIVSNFALDDDPAQEPALRRISGFNGSAQEHATWEELLNVESISTIKSLQLAGERGIPVFVIDSGNAGVLIPQLTLDPATESQIQSDVAAGNTVTVPRDPTPLNDWQGVGYLSEDAGGGAAFIISGGLNSASAPAGGGTAEPRAGGAVTIVLEDGTILVVPAGALGDGAGSSFTGDPVNIANGNFFREETDFSIPARGRPLAFERVYNSQSTYVGPLGRGWAHNWGDLLTEQPDASVVWLDGRGTAYIFVPDPMNPGGYLSPPGLRWKLTDAGTIYTLRSHDGWLQTFDAAGRLLSRRDRNNNTFTLAYDGSSRLITITDPASRSLTLGYNADGRIATVTDFTTRAWSYSYDAQQRLIQVDSPSDAQTPALVTRYGYDAQDRLASVIEPNGGTRSLEYYANGRVARVVDPLGGAMTLFYNPYKAETKVIDERGHTAVHAFNAAGNLVALTHADGTRESWTWQENRNTSHTDGLGHSESFQYDASGNLLRRVDPSGLETLFEYEPVYSNVTRMTSPGPRISTYDYDGNGNVTEFTDAASGIRIMVNNPEGLPETVTDPRGASFTRTYNSAGQVTSITTELPSTETRIYNARGTVERVIDANGHATVYTYDLLDRLITTVDAEGNLNRTAYDQGGRRVSTTNPRGAVTSFTYDLNDRLVRRTDPDGQVSSTLYDEVGNVLAETDTTERTTEFVYDTRNRRITTRYPDGAVARVVFDASGRIVSTFDPLGHETKYSYDTAGRVSQITDAQNVSMSYSYDGNGNVETMTDRMGGVSTFEYDPLNRLSELRGEGGRVETVDYDENGNVVERARYDVSGLAIVPDDPRTLPAERTRSVTYTYDVLNRLLVTVDAEGGTTTRSYDSVGNIELLTDAASHSTAYDYDRINRLTHVTRPDTGEVQIAYDRNGNRTMLTTPEGGTYRWTYDDRDRMTTITDPTGLLTTNEYDPRGNLLRQKWGDGAWRVMAYDPVDRLRLLRRSDGSYANWSYDLAGNIVRAHTEATRLSFAYDSLNRRTAETLSIENTGFSKTVSYDYDAGGNLSQITDPTGRVVSYSRQLPARLTGVSDNTGGPSAMIGYNGYGERSSLQFGNGRTGTMSYDGNGHIAEIDWSAAIGQFTYVRDPLGNPTSIDELIGGMPESMVVSYDDVSRPVTAVASNNPGTRSEVFGYDLNGNLPNPGNGGSLTFNPADQPLQSVGAAYSHDYRGNRAWVALPGDQRVETPHDVTDRLTAIRQYTNNTLTREVRYTYDALDRIVEVRQGDTVARVVNALMNRLVEYDSAGNPVILYSMGPALDDAFGVVVNGAVRYLHRDDVGSVRAVTSAAGSLIGTRHYGQFGRLLAQTGIADVPLGFAGRPFDAPTGLVDLRARFYDPATARFLSRDPLGLTPELFNLYTYAANRPAFFIDPLGLTPLSSLDAFLEGRWLGTGYGEEGLQWWAQQSINPDNNWFETGFYTTGGLFAALWTPDTWWKTGATLAGGWIIAPYAAEAGTAYQFFGRLGPSWHFGIETAGNLNVIHIGRHTVHGIHLAIGAVKPYAADFHIYLQRAFPFFRTWKP